VANGNSAWNWFGAISGIVGLAADVVTLTSLFRVSTELGAAPGVALPANYLLLWIALLVLIFYSIIVVAIYAHRFVEIRAQRYTWRKYDIDYILARQTASDTFTRLIGIPLLFSYFAVLTNVLVRARIADELLSAFGARPKQIVVSFLIASLGSIAGAVAAMGLTKLALRAANSLRNGLS